MRRFSGLPWLCLLLAACGGDGTPDGALLDAAAPADLALEPVDAPPADTAAPPDVAAIDVAHRDSMADTMADAAPSSSDAMACTIYEQDLLGLDLGPASCEDGVQDQDETDADCGGLTCRVCLHGQHCQLAGDCATRLCACDVCVLPGGFAPPVSFTAGTEPFAVEAFDFDGDGRLDLAVANEQSNDLTILLGDGHGGFKPAGTWPTDSNGNNMGKQPYALVRADFNGDGKADLASANFASDTISVWLGKGDGTLAPARFVAVVKGPSGLAVGDLDHDGKLDLVATSYAKGNLVTLLGAGDGTFTQKAAAPTDAAPYSVALGDFDGDGKLDAATGNSAGNSVDVLRGNGDGTFAPATSYDAGAFTRHVLAADLDGDGHLDLAATNFGGETLALYHGNGDGSFAAAHFVTIGAAYDFLAVADLDGDGRLDVIAGGRTSDNVAVLLGQPGGKLGAPTWFEAGRQPTGIAPGDFDGDGKIDLAVSNYLPSAVQILRNTR